MTEPKTKTTTELKARDQWGGHGDYVRLDPGIVIVEVIALHPIDGSDLTAVLLSDGSCEHVTPGMRWTVVGDQEREAYQARRRAHRLANELVAVAQALRDAEVGVSVNPSRIYIDVHGHVGTLASALGIEAEAGADYAVRKASALQVDITGDALVPPTPEPVEAQQTPTADVAESDPSGMTYTRAETDADVKPVPPGADVWPLGRAETC